ncbi:MAG: class I lanthipeptide [Holophagaceae bacterium]|nr:class I lanthipeptide [Holophagaceae bacterium]
MKLTTKLSLQKETLKSLTESQAQDVAAGRPLTYYCPSDATCYTDCGTFATKCCF